MICLSLRIQIHIIIQLNELSFWPRFWLIPNRRVLLGNYFQSDQKCARQMFLFWINSLIFPINYTTYSLSGNEFQSAILKSLASPSYRALSPTRPPETWSHFFDDAVQFWQICCVCRSGESSICCSRNCAVSDQISLSYRVIFHKTYPNVCSKNMASEWDAWQ